MIELGIKPDRLGVHLTTGADFSCVLNLVDSTGVAANWPAGTTLSLVFDSGTTWTATITGANATFAVDKAVSDLIADRSGVSLVYLNGTTDQTWAKGTVVRNG